MELLTTRCPWYVAGPTLGLVIVALLWATNQPLGATGSYVAALEWLKRPGRAPQWRASFFVGMVLGGAVFALAAGGYQPTLAYPTLDALGASLELKAAVLAGSGLLMGYGARTAGGCTSGHAMTGMAMLSPASVVSAMTFMAAAVGASNLMGFLFGGGR